MREKTTGGLLRITRAARGVVRKTSAAFIGTSYVILTLTGVPVALHAFSNGSFFVGSRVLGLLGIVLAVSATLVRIDALDRRSLDEADDEDTAVVGDGGQLEDASFRERFYREYVFESQFKHIEYGLYGVGILFMAVSFLLIT